MHARATREDVPLKPQVAAHALPGLLALDAIISTNSGTNNTRAARHARTSLAHGRVAGARRAEPGRITLTSSVTKCLTISEANSFDAGVLFNFSEKRNEL